MQLPISLFKKLRELRDYANELLTTRQPPIVFDSVREELNRLRAENETLGELVGDTLFYLCRGGLAPNINPALLDRLRAVVPENHTYKRGRRT